MSTAIEEIKKKLSRQEELETPGAMELAPKQALLNAGDAVEKNPDSRLRWVSLKNPDKMLARKAEGYEIVAESEGGRRIGDNMVLMRMNKKKYELKIARQQKLNKERMNQHKTEMANLAERLARELHDKHGIDIDVDRLLVNED